jgi:TRAP-type transport system small permease protein
MAEREKIGIEYGIPLVLITVLFIVGCMQIISRYVLSYPLIWGEEVMRLSFILLVFFGAAAVTMNKEHLAVDVVNILVKPHLKDSTYRTYEKVVLFLQAIFFLLCAYGSFQMAVVRWGTTSQTMVFWKVGYMYALISAAFFGSGIISLYLIFKKAVKG